MRVVSGVNNLDLVSNIKKTKNIKKNDSLNEKDFKSVLKEKKDSTIEKEEIIKPLDKKNTNEVDKKVEGNNFLEKADKNSNVEDSSTEAIKEISYDDISGMEEDLSDVSLESLLSLLFLINGKEGNDFSKLDVSKLKNSVELLTSEVLKQKVILNDGSLNIEMLENPEGIELNKFLADITKEIKSVDMKVHGNNILNTDNHFKDMIIKALNSKGVSNSEIKELSLNLKIIENPFSLDDSKRSKVLGDDILAGFKFEDMKASDDSKNMKSFSSNKFIEMNPSLSDSKVGINLNDSKVGIDLNDNKANVVINQNNEQQNLFSGNNQSENSGEKSFLGSNNKEDNFLSKIMLDEKTDTPFDFNMQRLKSFSNVALDKQDITINKFTMKEDLNNTILRMTKVNMKELIVKVNQGNLGEISIKLMVDSDNMKAVIKCSSKETYSLISNQDIKQYLVSENIKISDVEISLYSEDTTYFSQENSFMNQEGKNNKEYGNGGVEVNSLVIDEEQEELSISSLDIII